MRSMTKKLLLAGCMAIMPVMSVFYGQTPGSPEPSSKVTGPSAVTERAFFNQYCVICHNEKLKKAGAPSANAITLDHRDGAHVEQNAESWERVVRKVRAGMMPPAGMPRPKPADFESAIVWLENELDQHAVASLPPPGIHRLNRIEYLNAVRDLLALEVDPGKFLPSDDSTRGFDNIAGALSLSPALLEGYTSAAGKISRLAIGDVTAPGETVYRVPED